MSVSSPTSTVPSRSYVLRFLGRAAAVGIAVNLLGLVPAVYMMQVYDRVLTGQSLGTLLLLSLITLFLLAIMGWIDGLRAQAAARLNAWLDLRLAARQASAPLNETDYGALETLRAVLGGPALLAILDAPFAPLFLLVIFGFHPILGLVALAGLGAVLALSLLSAAWQQQAKAELTPLQLAQGRAQRQAADPWQALVGGQWVAAGLAARARLRQAQLRHAERSQPTAQYLKALRIALQSVMLGVAAWLVLRGSLSAGSMIAVSVIFGRAAQPIDQLPQVLPQWPELRHGWRRLALLDHPATPQRMLPPVTGLVQVEGLYQAAEQGGYRLRNINLTARPCLITLLIGPSGAGKSALLATLAGALPLSLGSLRYDGLALSAWPPAARLRLFGVMADQDALSEGTIAQNVAGFGPVDEQALTRALTQAGIARRVAQLPQGSNTPVGPGGMGLPAGLRRQLALARALYHDPAVLLLDDPTGALDAESEKQMRACLAQLRAAGKTLIIASHRASLLPMADQIVELSDGQMLRQAEKPVLRPVMTEGAAASPAPPPPVTAPRRKPSLDVVRRMA